MGGEGTTSVLKGSSDKSKANFNYNKITRDTYIVNRETGAISDYIGNMDDFGGR